MRLPRNPRWLNRAFAWLFGYFWLPCPLCGEDFGGHEWLPNHVIYLLEGGRGVCESCGNRAFELNLANTKLTQIINGSWIGFLDLSNAKRSSES